MCSSDELIHDERQVDLEEAIKMNETPMYLVPGRLTDAQMEKFLAKWNIYAPDAHRFYSTFLNVANTPIQPCADVETVGWVDPDILAIVRKDKGLSGMTLANMKATSRTIPLVRRADMEAQVTISYEKGWVAGKRDACNQSARVEAEKDAEIERLKGLLNRWEQCGCPDCHGDCASANPPVLGCIMQDTRAALNEGAAG